MDSRLDSSYILRFNVYKILLEIFNFTYDVFLWKQSIVLLHVLSRCSGVYNCFTYISSKSEVEDDAGSSVVKLCLFAILKLNILYCLTRWLSSFNDINADTTSSADNFPN